MKKQNLHWMKLDNAAKIYPAAKRKGWINFFRLSATLCENVDPEVLRSAINTVHRRFPSICARLRHGLFWYYLEETLEAPTLREEGPCPLIVESKKNLSKCVDWSKIDKTEYLYAMKKSVVDYSDILSLIQNALTDKIDDRETFMKGIDYSYYYEEEN